MPKKGGAPKDKTLEEIQPRQISLVASKTAKFGRAYANYVSVSTSPWDFTLRFCDAPPGSDVPDEAETVEAETIIQIILAPNVVPGLIDALKQSHKNFVDIYEEQPKEG